MAIKELDVFINAPFDIEYEPIFSAIAYAVVRYGFRVRCALEADDAGDSRFAKLCGIIRECKFGVHDISRTEVDGNPPLPRFNMPLELGLFLGARHFGSSDQKQKVCIVLDREKYRYQKFISDLAGQDIHSHAGSAKRAVAEVTTWLRGLPGTVMPGGGEALWKEYQTFLKKLRADCKTDRIKVAELSFKDLNTMMAEYIAKL